MNFCQNYTQGIYRNIERSDPAFRFLNLFIELLTQLNTRFVIAIIN